MEVGSLFQLGLARAGIDLDDTDTARGAAIFERVGSIAP